MTSDVFDRLATAKGAVHNGVAAAAPAATVPGLAVVPDERLDDALRAMAELLGVRAGEVLEANAQDMAAARADGIREALLDPLGLGDTRLQAMAGRPPARA